MRQKKKGTHNTGYRSKSIVTCKDLALSLTNHWNGISRLQRVQGIQIQAEAFLPSQRTSTRTRSISALCCAGTAITICQTYACFAAQEDMANNHSFILTTVPVKKENNRKLAMASRCICLHCLNTFEKLKSSKQKSRVYIRTFYMRA